MADESQGLGDVSPARSIREIASNNSSVTSSRILPSARRSAVARLESQARRRTMSCVCSASVELAAGVMAAAVLQADGSVMFSSRLHPVLLTTEILVVGED